jgi:hypothetical protein
VKFLPLALAPPDQLNNLMHFDDGLPLDPQWY